MPTTIQVKEDVYRVLSRMKENMGLETYDDVIRALLKAKKRMAKDYFGKYPKLKTFKREELDRLD
ncbi:MAG: antitoxin VapB family protein [Candidatus Hydrothermarchaeales archaeon]